MKQHSRSHIGGLLATLATVLVALLLLLNRQLIIDQINVWQYQPSSAIMAFAQRTSMSDQGTFYFYASQPSLESSQDFNNKCGRKEQNTAILGCYDGQRIYIYDVTDRQLDGIREVTAAHEMLHAAYLRMSDGERARVDSLLEAEYATLKDNKDFAERMAFYARTEPGERDNELHSVIGTEVATLSPELEAHYKHYFDDRSKVVDLHTKYASVFADLQNRGDALSARLTSLGNSIEQQSTRYNADVAQLNSDIESFNRRASDGGFSSQAQFQAERSALVDRAAQLDGRRTAINNDVVAYNNVRQQLQAIASQSEALNRSIDSSLAPAPSI